MPQVWLIRHAESLGNVDGSQADTPLSVRGRAQAMELRERLVGVTFDRALSSPLARARETARIALPGAHVEVDPALGEWRRLRDTFIDPADLTADFIRALTSGGSGDEESFEAFRERITGWAGGLEPGERVVAFTHYAVVRECGRAMTSGARVLSDVPHCRIFELEW
jgi:broad specificity phosphatase PhoE